MTNKEAIEVLVEIREDYIGDGETLTNGKEALDLAIKALKEVDDLRQSLKESDRLLDEEWGIIEEDEEWDIEEED